MGLYGLVGDSEMNLNKGCIEICWHSGDGRGDGR